MSTRPTRLSLLASWLLTLAFFLGGCGPRGVEVSINPASATVAAGGSFVFTADVTGADDPSVTWSLPGGAATGTLSSSGVYTAPQTPGEYTVLATSVEDPTQSDTARVLVTAATNPALSLSPNPVTVQTGSKQTFTATVTGTSDRRVTWSVQEGAAGGSVDAEGTYTAPSSPGVYHLVATSVGAPHVRDVAKVTVSSFDTVSVSISPATPKAVKGQIVEFTGTQHGGVWYSTSLQWSVVEAAGGGVTCKGTYLAPRQTGVFHVSAAYRLEPGRRALATVEVGEPTGTAVWVTPRAFRIAPQGQQTFSATVSGVANPDVTWSIREGAQGGSITPEGVYTAPALAANEASARYTVVATSKADPTRSAEALVTVEHSYGAYSLALNPSTLRLRPGSAASFAATMYYGQGVSYGGGVSYGAGVAYAPYLRWRVLEASGGSVTETGGYLAPNAPGVYHLAADAEDCEASGFATVIVE